MKTKKKLIYIYSKSKAIKLRKMGFSIVSQSVNYKYPKYDVYGFEDSPRIRDAIKSITGYEFN